MWKLSRDTHKKIMQNWNRKRDLLYHNANQMMMDYNNNYNIG